MLNFLTDYVLPLIGTFLVGASGWFATKFVANPIIEFYELRKKTREKLFFTANIGPIQLSHDDERISDKYYSAVTNLRRLASKFDAMDKSAFRPLNLWLIFRGYDLSKISAPLTGLSNSLEKVDGLKGKYRSAINKALKFSDDI